ncbi:hypothetical protein [Micromonospora sp. NPDC004551]|uniref:hypothetical protein n=1 Tax=Micromonospora sp. NPDC004551 TaxID=3154284 RepID=UPI0033B26B14
MTAEPVAGEPPPDRGENTSVTVVVTSGLVTETDRGVQRVNVLVTTDVSHREPGAVASPSGGSPDLVLACGEPDAPMIRYPAPFLSVGAE